MSNQPHVFDLTPDALAQRLSSLGMPGFRAKQVMQWVHERGIADPQQMTNLSKADRDRVTQAICFTRFEVVRHQQATDGTQKLLLQCDGHQTECVMIPAESKDSGRARRTACISSQVGCPVGCRFCASGLGGLEVDLTAGQIVEQVWQLNRIIAPDRISNIVFMGMGEPLSNFANVTQAIHALVAPWGFALSARRITLSTVGLPAQMRRLADQLELPITLAISLHAPNDDLRRRIIPWAELTSIEQIVDAGRYYFQQTGREITLEYILLREVNDRREHAEQLAKVARQLRSNVNLIRYNEVASLPFNRPNSDDVHRFQNTLKKAGVNCHIRASRGRDIAAACGQLRHEAQSSSN